MNAIEAQNLHKTFKDNTVLRSVSLSAARGDVIAVIGASGSGKSTFLRCLNLLEIPDEGEIIAGDDRLKFEPGYKGKLTKTQRDQIARIRRKVSMVFQGFNLWQHMTVLGNVIEAPIHVHGQTRSDAIEEARQLLDQVGLAKKADAYPSQLSGGQQQRAAIARALAVHPEVILFDEPTSALDPELVGEVLGVIQNLANAGRTMIIVTHEMAFARDVSTRTLFLSDGLIEEEGPSKQLFATPKSERLVQFLKSFRSGGFTPHDVAARV